MPIYEFQCENCHHVFEKLMSFSDPKPEQCVSCGGGPIVKLMSSTSFQLKGGGWYSDSYDGKSNRKPQKKSEPSSDKAK